MTYEQIKNKIEEDYNKVSAASSMIATTGRANMKTHYLYFYRALEELHKAVGPFILTKDSFIEYLKNLEESTNPDVYRRILDYCHDTLKLDI